MQSSGQDMVRKQAVRIQELNYLIQGYSAAKRGTGELGVVNLWGSYIKNHVRTVEQKASIRLCQLYKGNFFVFVFCDRISLYSFSACPGTHSVAQTGLKLTEICLSLSLEYSAARLSLPSLIK